jgi:SAM-dependent methyltransferase
VAAIQRRLTGTEGIDVQVLDMLALDLPDASVEGVLCRWGLMFPLPTEQALAEAARVLRPRRRLVLAVWAEPDRNPWITLVDDALHATGHPIPADRRWPGRMFSLANPRRLRTMMVGAGFEDIAVEEVSLVWEYDDFEAYWDEEALIPGPFEDYLRGLVPTSLSLLRARLRSSLAPYGMPDGGYAIPGVSLVARGTRS